ncbi:MAG: hypothetical protein JST54_01025 [Deltaproteobacteria bacterium]|nr:hypothetical protein [Deltaproteobacteria bacterium]
MGIDTYLVIPTRSPERARRELAPDELVQVGADYVVLYQGERFAEVQRDPKHWGAEYARGLPPWLRRGLEPRGLLAFPEAGRAPEAKHYAELAAGDGLLFLPVAERRRGKQRQCLLVALSKNREKSLLDRPKLVRALVETAIAGQPPIPGSLQMGEIWIPLQRMLFDLAFDMGVDAADVEALAPRSGLPLYEDQVVESARLIRAERVGALSRWLASLPADAAARSRKTPSAAAAAFPASLGASESDDRRPTKRAPKTRASPSELEAELARVQRFYAEAATPGSAVLAVRYRA